MGTPSPAPFNCFVDSDGPVADFDPALQKSGLPCEEFKHLPGVYLWLGITPGAAEAIDELHDYDLQDKLRVWILTKTPSGSPYAYTEKVLWYRQHFPWLEDRIILTHDKHLMGEKNDILLDDRPHKANADLFRGTFVLFDTNKPIEGWDNLLRVVSERVN